VPVAGLGSQAYWRETCLFRQQYGASGGVVFQGAKLSLYTVITASRAVEVSYSATGRAAIVKLGLAAGRAVRVY